MYRAVLISNVYSKRVVNSSCTLQDGVLCVQTKSQQHTASQVTDRITETTPDACRGYPTEGSSQNCPP